MKQNQSMPDHVSHLSKSGFDMSQSLMFTAAPGMILPVYSDFLNAGEKVTYSTDLFARTQPLVTAAMCDVDVYIDWFFVPMQMLFTAWGNDRFQTNDFLSSWFDGVSPIPDGGFPVLSSQSFFSNAQSSSTSQQGVNNAQIFYSSVGNSSLYFYNPYQFERQGKSMYRMLDLLGFNPNPALVYSTSSSDSLNPNVFPWKALAYQCAYQHFYRNDDYERLDVSSYNWDKYFGVSDPVNLQAEFSTLYTTNYSPQHPFILRYADYRRDYFTSVKPSPILSGINLLSSETVSSTLTSVNNYLDSGVINSSNYGGSGGGDSFVLSGSLNSSITQVSSFSNLFNSTQSRNLTGRLRSLFAVEKLLRITGRANKDYDSQVLAHFGFKVPHDVKHELTHLHTSHGMLHVGEVVGTADTWNGETGSALGEISGKGYVSIHENGNKHFTAPVDGVFLANFRAIPRVRVVDSFDKQNSIANRVDFYIPEFDKLGMQPIYAYEFIPDRAFIGSSSSATFGWQYRYQQFKTKYDRATRVFSPFGNRQGINQYSSWVVTYRPFANYINSQGGVSHNILSFNSGVGAYLKCPPTILNNIMSVPYSPAFSDSYSTNPAAEFYTDPFLCDFRANVKKVSTMSPTGEPDMISL